MNGRDRGRLLLQQWEAAKPTNFFDDDRYLQLALARRVARDRLGRVISALQQAGADSAGAMSRVSAELDRPEHWPRLEGWNRIGERTAEVLFHPAHHEIGRLVWRSGIPATRS